MAELTARQGRVRVALARGFGRVTWPDCQCKTSIATGAKLEMSRRVGLVYAITCCLPSRWCSQASLELMAARMVTEGWPSKKIGSKLFISKGTAKLHLHQIYRKTQLCGPHVIAALCTQKVFCEVFLTKKTARPIQKSIHHHLCGRRFC